jgi:dCMP deaminase
MKPKIINAHMATAHIYAQLSHARRLKVGAIAVKDGRIISIGYNGMPSGWDNNCEITLEDGSLKTRPEVLHAESNCITKMAKSNESGEGADMFITHAPCIDCAKLIYQSGIKRVFFGEAYRDDAGVRFLQNSGIPVEQIET